MGSGFVKVGPFHLPGFSFMFCVCVCVCSSVVRWMSGFAV